MCNVCIKKKKFAIFSLLYAFLTVKAAVFRGPAGFPGGFRKIAIARGLLPAILYKYVLISHEFHKNAISFPFQEGGLCL